MQRSPFEFGRELSSRELVDREEEVSVVLQTIRDGGRMFLIGPRRYGKTSILRVVQEKAEKDGMVILRYDAEAYPTLQLLAEAVIADTARKLTGPVERIGQKVREFFSALRPEVTFDPLTNSFGVSLSGQAARGGEPALLPSALDGLNRMAAEEEDPVAVIIDEFQSLVERGRVGRTEDAEGQLRAAVQRHDHLAYVFAGSKTRLLTQMTGDASRPFYRLGSRFFLGPIPRADFAEFIVNGFASGGYRIKDKAVDAILDLAKDVPYNVQRLAYACWSFLRDSRRKVLRPDDVDHVLERLVRRDDPFYTQTWNGLVSTQQKMLLAIAKSEGEGLFSKGTLDKYGLALSTARTALEALVKSGITREEEVDSRVRYRLEDPFLAAWMDVFVVGP